MASMDVPVDRPIAARATPRVASKPAFITWATLALMTTSSVASLRAAPTMAVYGPACVFLYVVPAIVFLMPTALVSAELASGWSGGVFRWVSEGISPRWGLLAVCGPAPDPVAGLLWARPAVTVLGLDVPPVVGSAAAIQSSAAARVSLRIPPGLEGHAAQDALIEHLRKRVPWGLRCEQPIAAAIGASDARVVVLPTALMIAFGRAGWATIESIPQFAGALRLDQISVLYQLIHRAERGEVEPAEGLRQLQRIRTMRPRHGALCHAAQLHGNDDRTLPRAAAHARRREDRGRPGGDRRGLRARCTRPPDTDRIGAGHLGDGHLGAQLRGRQARRRRPRPISAALLLWCARRSPAADRRAARRRCD